MIQFLVFAILPSVFVRYRRDSYQQQRDEGAKLVFSDVCVTLGKTQILRNVSGFASVNQMLGIMGSTGNDAWKFLNLSEHRS